MRWTVALMATLAVATAAWGQKFDAESRAREVAPFLDAQTPAILHIDLAAFDLAGAEKWALEALGEAGPQGEELKEFAQGMQAARAWIEQIRKAGAKDLYVLLSTSIRPVPIMVPLPPGADAQAIGRLLQQGITAPGTPPPSNEGPFALQTATIHNAVVLARKRALQALQAQPPAAPQPELASALAAAGDASMRLVLIPSPEVRQAFEKLLPQLPPELGGGPIAEVSNGLRWAALGVNLGPSPSFALVVQSPDPQAAASLKALAGRAIDLGEKSLGGAKLAGLLAPRVDGGRMLVSLDPQQMKTLALEVLVPMLKRAREQALRTASASNMRQILVACLLSATEAKGAWPDGLDKVQKYLGKSGPRILVNPRQPQRQVGYVYVKPAPVTKIPAIRTVVLYEAYDKWEGGINVGYADGHIAWITDEAEFKAQLQQDK